MLETGENASGTFSETVVGTDAATLTSVLQDTTLVARSEEGYGEYMRSESGAGASFGTSPTTGTIAFELLESGDYRVGSLALSGVGADRYLLLEEFVDPSTTGNGAPGSVDFAPTGAAINPVEAGTGQAVGALAYGSPFASGYPGWATSSPVDAPSISGGAVQSEHAERGLSGYERACFAVFSCDDTEELMHTRGKLLTEPMIRLDSTRHA